MATIEEMRAELARRKQGSFGDAKQAENARTVLEGLDGADMRPAERAQLELLRRQAEANKSTIDSTNAGYRGFQRGATLGLSDDMAGVKGAVMGDGFTQGRQESLTKDRAAAAAYPDEFRQGEGIGGILPASASMLVGGPALNGVGVAAKIAAGTTAGMGWGALQGQSDYEMAGSPDGERLSHYAAPTAIGAVTGGAVYPLGKAAGYTTKAIRDAIKGVPNGFGRMPTRTLTGAVQSADDAGIDIERYLASLSPEATLMDSAPSMQRVAQGLATVGGAGGSRVARAVNKRADDAASRIKAEMDQNISAPNAAFAERQRLATERTSVWGPDYDAATAHAGALEVRPLLNTMKEAQRNAGPDVAPALSRFVADLEKKAPNGLISASQLHWIRSDLSNAIGALGGIPKVNKLATNALKEMDNVLDTVPGYAAARTGYANTYAMERAIGDGQEALRGGRVTAKSPDEFAAEFAKLSDAQKDAFRTGLRRDLAGLMGTSSNAPAAAWREFSKEWNPEKLRIALGDDAEPIIKRLRSEKVFSETRGKIDGNSQTAFRAEAANELGPYRSPETGLQPSPIARAKRAAFDDPMNRLINSIIYGTGQSKRNSELGEMLSLSGPARDDLLKKLIANTAVQKQPSRSAKSVEQMIRALVAGGGGSAAASYK